MATEKNIENSQLQTVVAKDNFDKKTLPHSPSAVGESHATNPEADVVEATPLETQRPQRRRISTPDKRVQAPPPAKARTFSGGLTSKSIGSSGSSSVGVQKNFRVEHEKPPQKPTEQYPMLLKIGTMSTNELLSMVQKSGAGVADSLEHREDIALMALKEVVKGTDVVVGSGILNIDQDGYGFLRQRGGSRSSDDLYISRYTVRNFGLRQCDMVAGVSTRPRGSGKYYSIEQPLLVNGWDPNGMKERKRFDKLGSTYPDEFIKLENRPKELSTRLIDLIAPIGKGQRALLVAPPKAGKTILLKQIAKAIRTNSPNLRLIVALIGERPEEVTDIRRSIDAEVFHSTFDESVDDHTRSAEVALERAKRLVELGEDVVILLDSLTRLARAYNVAVPSSGKTLSGGMDPYALYPPKRFFGAARNCEHGGSLTIVSTVLVDTGSRLDDLIYEEFKGTGNMELHLNRALAERRLFPAIDIQRSGTRHEELLLDEKTLSKVWLLRRMAAMMGQDHSPEATEKIVEIMLKTKTNTEFLDVFNRPGTAIS